MDVKKTSNKTGEGNCQQHRFELEIFCNKKLRLIVPEVALSYAMWYNVHKDFFQPFNPWKDLDEHGKDIL